MPFKSVRQFADAMDTGQTWTSYIHKTGGPASFGAGRWADLSMGAGTPKYNAYVGTQATATPLIGAGNDGIYAGPTPAAGQTKHLNTFGLQSTSTTLHPASFLLCDYLLHYPLIDGDDTAQQDLDNTASLPRYATGDDVQCMAICTTPMTANAVATVNYTNQAGVAGRVSTFTLLATSVVGCIVSSADNSGAAGSATPFIPLASGDGGIRSIQSVTLSTGAGGFFALALVRPLSGLNLFESQTATEIQHYTQRGASIPRIFDGAYLNLIYLAGQNGTPVTLRGWIETAWS